MRKIPTSALIMGVLLVGVIAIIGFTMWSSNQRLADIKLPIEIEDYFDYQCSHCANFAPVVEELKAEYGDKIKVTYRHFPFLNDQSTELAYGAVAAELQGKFSEYHNEVYKRFRDVMAGNAEVESVAAVPVAEAIGLDMELFAIQVTSDQVKARIDADLAAGRALGVSGTPTVFIFGKSLAAKDFARSSQGGVDYQPFKDTIKRLVEKASNNQSATS